MVYKFCIGDRVVIKSLLKIHGLPSAGMTGVVCGYTEYDDHVVTVVFDELYRDQLSKMEWGIGEWFLELFDEELYVDQSVFENYLNGCFIL